MLNETFGLISSTKIMGVVPLDLVFHALIGAFITVLCLAKGLGLKMSLLILGLLAGAKEFYDYTFHYQTHWYEYALDFLFSLVFLLSIIFFKALRRSSRWLKQASSDKPIEKIKIYHSDHNDIS